MADRRQREEREEYSASAKNWIDKRRSGGSRAIKIPEDWPVLRITKAGEYRFDFFLYRVGQGNPCADPGSLHMERTYWEHGNIGPNQERHVCLAKTFREPCPVCEHRAKLARNDVITEAQQKLIDRLKPSERQLWLPKNLDEPDKGVQIFPYSQWLFGKYLIAKIERQPKDKRHIYYGFANHHNGLTVVIGAEEEKKQGMTMYTLSDIQFEKRDGYDYTDVKPDDLPCLDDCVNDAKPTYDELYELFHQTGGVEEDEGAEPETPADDAPPRPGAGKRTSASVPAEPPTRGRAKPVDDEEPAKPSRNGKKEEDAPAEFRKGDKVSFTRRGKDLEGVVDVVHDDYCEVECDGKSFDVDLPDLSRVVEDEPTSEPDENATAEECGIELGMTVRHKKHGDCEVTRISNDGTSLTIVSLENEDDVFRAIAPSDCRIITKADAEPAAKKGKPAPAKKGAKDAEEELGFDEEEEATPKKKQAKKEDEEPRGKAAASNTGKKATAKR